VVKVDKKSGVLLLEVLFSLTLLAVGVTACLQALGQGLSLAKRSQEYHLAELALDELYFRLTSGAADELLYEGGSGTFNDPPVDLPDLRYEVVSEQIDPVPLISEEELEALEKAGEPLPPPDPRQEIEERYRMIDAKVTWRGGKEDLELYTIVRVPIEQQAPPTA